MKMIYLIVNTSTICHSNQRAINELRNNELFHKYDTLFKLVHVEARDGMYFVIGSFTKISHIIAKLLSTVIAKRNSVLLDFIIKSSMLINCFVKERT